MATGRVTYYNEGRGFGFIRNDDGGADLFVHVSALAEVDVLRVNDRVEFVAQFDERKSKEKATEVRVIV